MSESDTDGFLTSSQMQNIRSQTRNTDTEKFKSIIKKCGIDLKAPGEFYVITQEQALVSRDLEEKLQGQDITEFIKGLKIFIKNEQRFKKALIPTIFKKLSSQDEDNSIKIQQESLIRLFLKVNSIQQNIIEILMEEITNNSEESQDTSYFRLLLNQLRYLPHIKNSKILMTQLTDILEIASFACQHEILNSLPEILPDSEYHDTAKQLAKMLDKNEELSSAIIDCLSALNLEQDIRAEIQDHILSRILLGASINTFPILLEFLMTDYKSHNLNQTFFKIRNALDIIMSSGDRANKEKESGKIVIFNRLQALTTTPKTVSETWINVITTIKVHTDHKPIDLLILFMLHLNAKFKKRIVENIFRKRVKAGLFKCLLLEQLFEKYIPQQLLRDYFNSIVEIGCNLLRTSNEPTITEFGTTLFKLLFNHEYTERIHRQEMLDNLILLTGAGDHKNITAILKIFTILLEDIAKIQHHTVLLMRLLEKLDSFDLKNIQQVFEILCTVTCSDESLSGLKQEIHIIVRKQLSSSKRSVKIRGIIAAVVMAKHIATTQGDQSEIVLSEDSFMTLAHLKGEAKEAAAILELANTSTMNTPELLGLYYDQLANMLVKADNLDKNFVSWLYETITIDFQSVFVTETVCDSINDLEFEMQYNLNSEEELDSPLGVNIAELTLRSDSRSILLLSPHFRLLRLLHYRQQNGDLSSIDALLGCSVILPKTDLIDTLGSEQLRQISDCLFHCINWFREIISGFVTQRNRNLRAKIIQRINNMTNLEKLLRECLENIPEHRLPVCYFDALSQISKQSISPIGEAKNKRHKKKFKSADTVDESIMPTAAPSTSNVNNKITKSAAKKTAANNNANSQPYIINFREMDTDIVKLLKYPLENEEITQSSDHLCLNTKQLNFILNDFVTKLSFLTTNRDLGFSHLNIISPLDLITDCVQILPNINKHFITINRRLSEIIDKHDGCEDSLEMFSESAVDYKISFGLVLEILSLIFSWSGFQHSKRVELLRDLLKAFRRPESTQTLSSANRLILELIERLENYIDHCLVMGHGVNLVKIMESLHSITPSQEIRSKISKTSGNLLSKRWCTLKGSPESGKDCATNLDILIKAYLSSANVKTICGLVGTLQEQAPNLKSKEDCLEMLRSVDKANFYIFYRNLLNYLHERIKIEVQALTNMQHIILWKTTALTMQGLMTIAKAQETKSNLVCFLKKSIAILKLFLSHGIPILEIMLKSKPDQVVEVFKIIQTNTRFLHHLCCYSKLNKDASLMSYVPQFRLTLETLVYRVKAALVANNCSAAFWMGNLKNRDLQGDDILSQSTTSTTQNAEEEEEELADDEESDDDIFGDDTMNSKNKNSSGSEVYDA